MDIGDGGITAATRLVQRQLSRDSARATGVPKNDDESAAYSDDGSNARAFAPSRSKTGNAILLRNPHLAWTAGYWEAHVTVPGKLDFYGVYHVDPDPKNLQPLSIVAKPKGRPNGITLSPDGRKLYVANSDEHALYVYDVAGRRKNQMACVLINAYNKGGTNSQVNDLACSRIFDG